MKIHGICWHALEGAIRRRIFAIGGLVALLAAALVGFAGIPQQFFPDSTRTQFRIAYRAPQGTPIQSVSAAVKGIEEKLVGDPRVRNVGTFIGSGSLRF